MGRTIKLLLLFFTYQLAVNGAFKCLYMLYNHSTEMPVASGDAYVTFLLVVQVTIALCLSVHLLLGKYVRLGRKEWNFCKSPIMWMWTFVFIVGMGLWNNYLSELAALPNTKEDFFEEMMSRPLGIFATVIMASIMEELLFRGAIQGHLMRLWKNPLWAIIVSSFLFGVVHGNPAQIPFAFIMGLGLGWIYYKTGSLAPCFFMHFVNNGSAVLIFGLTDNPNATMIGTYGIVIATGLALLGGIFTFLGVYGIKKYLKDQSVVWYNSDDL